MELIHIVFDVWSSDSNILKYEKPLRELFVDAANKGGAHIIYSKWHQFEPWGVTGFLLLQESHISIHTWPEEENFAAIDIFPCGSMDHELIVNILREKLNPAREKLSRLKRG